MGKFVLKNAKILFNEFDLSGELNEVTLNLTKAEVDITVHGQSAIARLGGLKSLDASWSGFFEANAGGTGSDNIMFGNLGTADRILTIIPEGSTVGDPCYFTKVTAFEYSTGGTIGDAMSFTGSAMSSDGNPIVRGYLLSATSYTIDTDGADTNVIGAVRANDTLYGVVHVTAFSSFDAVDVTVESDTDTLFDGSETTRLTFTQGLAVTAEQKTSTSTITDTFWRAVINVTGTPGSVTVFVAVGVIPNAHYPRITE